MAIDPQLTPFIARLEEAWPEPVLSLPVDVWRERVESLSAAARTPYPAGLDVETRIIDGPRPVRVRMRVTPCPLPRARCASEYSA